MGRLLGGGHVAAWTIVRAVGVLRRGRKRCPGRPVRFLPTPADRCHRHLPLRTRLDQSAFASSFAYRTGLRQPRSRDSAAASRRAAGAAFSGSRAVVASYERTRPDRDRDLHEERLTELLALRWQDLDEARSASVRPN